MDNNENEKIDTQISKNKKLILNTILIIGFTLLFIYYFLFAPFGNKDVIIHISSHQSVKSVTQNLEEKRAVKDDFTLKIFIKLLKKGKGIISGDYLIEKNSPVWVVAWQIGRGHHKIEPIKITIKEGLTNNEIADIFAQKIKVFRRDLFLSATADKQGYLFPDTYYFFELDTTDELVEKLINNFEVRTKEVKSSINSSGKTINGVLTMASILEGEASGKEDINIISGILWKRIEKGMPLQVDVDKSTYINKGLPKIPINNPGLISIKAAISPIDSPYLYYLHDKDGKVHYAKTFEEHKINIKNYLK